MLKPSSFFDVNPALDVPQVSDMKSRNAFGAKTVVGAVDTNGHANGSNGKSCCA